MGSYRHFCMRATTGTTMEWAPVRSGISVQGYEQAVQAAPGRRL